LPEQRLPILPQNIRRRTKPATVGGRVASEANRVLAGRLAEEARGLAPDSFDVHLLTGDLLHDAERLEEAEASYRKALAMNHNSSTAHHKLAEVVRLQGDFDEAIAELREVMRIYPDHYNAHYNLGEMFRLEGKFDESAKQFREYVRLAPNTPQTQRNLRRAQQYTEQYSD